MAQTRTPLKSKSVETVELDEALKHLLKYMGQDRSRLEASTLSSLTDVVIRVQVIPLTSRVDKLYPSETYITLRGKKAKAMADQLATVSKKRLMTLTGTVTNAGLEGIKRAISIQLDL